MASESSRLWGGDTGLPSGSLTVGTQPGGGVQPVWPLGSEVEGWVGGGPHVVVPLCSLKASEAPELDEDEGFSDWSQKPERPPQLCRDPSQGERPQADQEDRQVGGCRVGALPHPPARA